MPRALVLILKVRSPAAKRVGTSCGTYTQIVQHSVCTKCVSELFRGGCQRGLRSRQRPSFVEFSKKTLSHRVAHGQVFVKCKYAYLNHVRGGVCVCSCVSA